MIKNGNERKKNLRLSSRISDSVMQQQAENVRLYTDLWKLSRYSCGLEVDHGSDLGLSCRASFNTPLSL